MREANLPLCPYFFITRPVYKGVQQALGAEERRERDAFESSAVAGREEEKVETRRQRV